MRILLVEDDAMNGESIAEELREQSYAVDWVSDGHSAALALQTLEYDLILLDLGLPRKQGLDVLTEFRARGCETPVLIITARDAIDDRVKGIERQIVRIVKIKRHNERPAQRPVIKMGICVGDVYKEVEVTITERSGFNYPLLIGRNFLKGSFLIDSARTHR